MEDYLKIDIIGVLAIAAGATAHQAWDLCVTLYLFLREAGHMMMIANVIGVIVGGFAYVSKMISK